MSNVLDLPQNSLQPPIPRVYSTSTLADLLQKLGDVPPERVRLDPPPGDATLDDLILVNEQGNGPICEWVKNTLVEKTVGQHESWLAMIIIGELYQYTRSHDAGMLLVLFQIPWRGNSSLALAQAREKFHALASAAG